MRPSVYISRSIAREAVGIIAASCDYRIWNNDQPVPAKILEEEIKKSDGVLTTLSDQVNVAFITGAPNLKIISNMAAGFDNIDIGAATAKGVMVTNTPGILTNTTADLAFALFLAASRRLVEAENFLRSGQWQAWEPLLLTGRDIYGATLGIIGLGQIGSAVARRAKGFDMNIIYCNRKRNHQTEAELGATYASLSELLSTSDIVSIHCPLTAETRGLISYGELALMKPAAVLVNTARGGIVDEGALYEALLHRRIFAAGLDVFSQEPLPLAHPLLKLPNVVLLPHIGSASIATRTKMAIMAASDLVSGLTGKIPLHLVNPEVVREYPTEKS
ncbi:MAG: Glyoxylate/hydroxypyruvate reductase B [Pelotomaculum sp. PtaB.Bin104]|nr:MAG: Glyoxylate/hydroxypyruvate reductase B [Pelotomaculum sp. PtaB.Bin104]